MDSSQQWRKIGKFVGIVTFTLAINHLFKKIIKLTITKKKPIKQQELHQQNQEYIDWGKKQTTIEEYNQGWGSLKILDGDCFKDGLLDELRMMTQAIYEVQRVNNLIVDLQMNNVLLYPCPIIAHHLKVKKDDPYLSLSSVVKPGEFVIQNCVFRSGQSIQCQKKFMRSGPRISQFFNAAEVRADIVCLGSICPGINTAIRQLVLMLKDVYKVPVVKGIKYSFKGYYENKNVQLTPEMVKTIHHYGGCYLGICRTQFNVALIVDNMLKRKVNQVYMIGAKNTLKAAYLIYKEIKKRRQKIAICVLLKAINKEIKMFDTVFGFQSAVEETQKVIEAGYVFSRANTNGIALIKVPGKLSGFLALDACKAARNVNICLVPEFSFDLYGKKGLLNYLGERIKHKGNCIIVYSQGALRSARDLQQHGNCKSQQLQLDKYFKQLFERSLYSNKLGVCNVMLFDAAALVRCIPANSFDNKLCCQVAHSSIFGLMCGYTNFVSGHLANKSAMVPITQIISGASNYFLKPQDQDWQRLLASTGQPSFINQEDQVLQ